MTDKKRHTAQALNEHPHSELQSASVHAHTHSLNISWARHQDEVEEAQRLRLTREDQIRVADTLINPPKANARLARAAKTHARLVGPR